jgi:hypothetical protein
VIINQNPLTIIPININMIVVLETIEESKTVYKADSKSSAGPLSGASLDCGST